MKSEIEAWLETRLNHKEELVSLILMVVPLCWLVENTYTFLTLMACCLLCLSFCVLLLFGDGLC